MARRLVAVFGGTGFIGRHLVPCLAAEGWTVRVAVRRPAEARALVSMGEPGRIVAVRADLTDPDARARAVADARAVVNLVGVFRPQGRRGLNVLHAAAPGALAARAAEAGAERFVQISALGADADAASEYARTKAGGEAAVLEAFPGATILRPAAVFGDGDRFFNAFAAMARVLPVLPILGPSPDGPRLQPVWVGDVARAIGAALARPGSGGRIFEIAGPRVLSLRQVLETVLALTGRRRPLVALGSRATRILAALMGALPGAPLNRDQARLLEIDNVASGGLPGLAQLGIEPTPLETRLPLQLRRFRRS